MPFILTTMPRLSLKILKNKWLLIFPALLLGFVLWRPFLQQVILTQEKQPDFLTFEELRKFARNPHPGWFLESKLKRFWETPLIHHEAFDNTPQTRHPEDPRLGRFLRVVSWNIEKSLEMQNAILAFTDEKKFAGLVRAPAGTPEYEKIMLQRAKLEQADIILLQEMDIGTKRSGYINAAAELAKALKMNYVYGAEQLEIDPVYLGLEKIFYDDGAVDTEATEYFAADPKRYKGVFGCAVLSRYPIKRAQVFQLKSQAYHWYKGEKPRLSFVEKARRLGAEVIFENLITREMKLGGRIFFRVDLDIPGVPQNTLTIINIHLEIKCQPEGRDLQMAEILAAIRGIRHPVILAGDFNSAPEDLSPTSAWRVMERTVENPETWLNVATTVFLPQALVINMSRFATKFTKNFQDPTAKNIPVLSPNKVKPMFDRIENYRFMDGGVFDFRGDKQRSINGHNETLANANHRDFKGFKTTFSVKRPIGSMIGKYRLDWFFVKSFLKSPADTAGPYRFAPHFGETLEELNTGLLKPISDHHPNVVDIPFDEPKFEVTVLP